MRGLRGIYSVMSESFYLMRGYRSFSLWSMKKDPELESALSRNRRWVVNNQIKNIILHHPDQAAPVDYLQKKFKTLDLQGKALNWLKKYPCCFEVYLVDDKYYCRLTKQMMVLVEEEESVRDMQEPSLVVRLTKLLMLSVHRRMNVVKFNEIKRNFGFSDDYLIRIVPKYPELFRLVNYSGRRSSMEIELVSRKPGLAVSAIESLAELKNSEPSFRGTREMDKRTVGLVHELLSLTLWKKLSIMKLGHFRREFNLPEKLNVLLLKHPGIFYVSNKYQIYTVLLREAYNGSVLVEQDPFVAVKEKFGELMQEGLHERNRRNHQANLKKKSALGTAARRLETRKDKDSRRAEEDEEDHGGKVGGLFDPEERKRFYKALFDDTGS
ncbi:unnamed protein product [Rhodiola kirilowii]